MMKNILEQVKQGELTLLAGRPEVGKTSLIAEMAEYMACVEKLVVIVFSLQHEKQHMLSKYIKGANNEKLIIDDTPGISITEVRNKCLECRQKQELEMVFIDGLPLMSGAASSASRVDELKEIVLGLKLLAKELDIPVVAVTPLSRYPNRKPALQDFREYGFEVERIVDSVVFIWKEKQEIMLSKISREDIE